MTNHILIEKTEQCCACGACVNTCPRNAIQMKEDAAGFLFPSVDESLCVNCGLCVKVCTFTEKGAGAHGEPEVFAAALKDQDVLRESSSGGVFSALANAVLDRNGVVFGAAWTEDLALKHIAVENKADLQKLRGSKYAQSSTGTTFRDVKKILAEGRTVLYSGTPCQIAGLKAYLGTDPENLLTADLVCHGVPSQRMLRDDLQHVSRGRVSDIRDLRFRDKQYGWGTKGSFRLGNKKVKYNAGTSPYYFYFLKGEVYRESCYRCRFPSEGRQGDVTLGDYWGIQKKIASAMENADPELGISCILINSEKGKQWMSLAGDALTLAPSDRKSVEKRNGQLTHASAHTPEHETLLTGYIEKGHEVFREGYRRHTKDHIIRTVKNMIPGKIKRAINELLDK